MLKHEDMALAYDSWRKMFSSVSGWRAVSEHTEAMTENLLYVVNAQIVRSQRRVLQIWRHETAQGAELQDELDKLQMRTRESCCRALSAAGLRAWTERVQEKRYFRGTTTSVARAWERAALKRFFNVWQRARQARHAVRWVVHAKVGLGKELLIMTSRAMIRTLSIAFELWSETLNTAQRRRLAEVLSERLVRRDIRTSTRKAFEAWMWRAHQQKRGNTMSARFMCRSTLKMTSAAFGRWTQGMFELRCRKQASAKVGARLEHRKQAVAFDTWVDHARMQRRAAEACARLVAHWRLGASSAAFDNWRRRCSEQRRIGGARGKLIARLLHRAGSLALDEWREQTLRQHRTRVLLCRTGSRQFRRRLLAAFDSWRQHVCRLSRRIYLMLRMAKRWKNRFTGRAFDSWVVHSQNMRKVKSVGARIVCHWAKRLATSTFDSWLVRARTQVLKLHVCTLECAHNRDRHTDVCNLGSSSETPGEYV